ncbi:MAG: aliphatic sulfonates ABC transporter substrate-binding protein [Bradyrhizobiaceae bacterium]|nr:MAG: aliphatic sulfonates ABC transporter substrate-binding protein [Bradyrhizobiaceae bacterium]
MHSLNRRHLLTLAAGGVAMSQLGRSAKAADNVVNFAYQSGDVNVLLMYVAGKGLFEKYNVDVKLLPFAAGPQQLPALAAGEADLAWMGEFPAITSFANGLPLQIFLVERTDTSHQRLVANPAKGIKGLDDLKGKSIGVTIGATSHFLALLALSKVGLTASDVTLVNLTPANMPPAYLSDRIDAAFTWEPNITQIEKAGGLTIATPSSLGRYTAGVLVARQEFIQTKSEALQRFLAAWHEGLTAYRQDPLSVMPFEAKRLGVPVEEVVALVKRQNSYRPSFEEELTNKYLGGVGQADQSKYVEHLKEIAEFLVQINKIKSADVNWAGLINPQPVAAFLKS